MNFSEGKTISGNRRTSFIEGLRNMPTTSRLFDPEFQKEEVLKLSNLLTNEEFEALYNIMYEMLKQKWNKTMKGLVASLAREIIGGSDREADRIFNSLIKHGFFELSKEPRQGTHSDPAYDWTLQFWGFENLICYLKVGDLHGFHTILG